ncbi:protein sidekick-1 isoform X2 [Agrilus planipennis]|uniref:Protein sidekick-1 isoform X2 n=1 Tax=Agrilus planipennis TaxID=224129 RepID=A0A1W4WCF9_AGRPL|nr:protein sidekick-1 isoform X2 [Agrilus planipennis]
MYSLWKVTLFFLLFIVFITGSKIQQYAVDVGRNATIPCRISNTPSEVNWVRKGKGRLTILDDGSLFLNNVSLNDSGIYFCISSGEDGNDLNYTVNVKVRTTPNALNFTVHPKTVIALLCWDVLNTGGYPITGFAAEYRLFNSSEDWKVISSRISSNSRTYEVYNLKPNTTYTFRMWATNQLGQGAITEVHKTTLHNNQSAELARHFLTNAHTFDTRVWAIAVGIVMGTLLVLGTGTSLLLYQECRTPNAFN